ncbi:MAG: AmmeMemoRadiSam system protein B [Deltaproteobacteria bacterium]|nr:AmmeMemoRadiSam system protein B [Deltaproteobacteria bacterium]
MVKGAWVFTVFLSFFLSCGDRPWPEAAERDPGTKGIRESILAGTWYPGNGNELRRTIQGYLSRVKAPRPEGDLRGIIVPHAGYMYSGQVAAHAYHLLQGAGFTRMVLIGPSHRHRFRGVSADLHQGYRTPLGTIPVDLDFARKLLHAEGARVRSVPEAHSREHSLEIQVPFLQVVLKDFHIVPLVMGEQDFETCSALAAVLGRLLQGDTKTLLLASTDLSHFHGDTEAKNLDLEFIRNVREYDPQGLADSLFKGACEACGGGPTIATMIAARALGADRAEILQYATSGGVTGNRTEVVGYLSAALMKGK